MHGVPVLRRGRCARRRALRARRGKRAALGDQLRGLRGDLRAQRVALGVARGKERQHRSSCESLKDEEEDDEKLLLLLDE